MTDNPTRRRILQLTGTSTMLSFVGLGSADVDGQTPTGDGSRGWETVDHDLLVRNNRPEDVSVTVELTEPDESEVGFENTYHVEGSDGQNRLTVGELPVSAGRYEVAVSVDGGQTETLSWTAGSPENRDFERLSVRCLPDGSLAVDQYVV